MPSLSCCPLDSMGKVIEYPSSMTAYVDSITPVSCGFRAQFAVVWDGSQWTGTVEHSITDLTVSLGCGSGNGALLSWNLGSGEDCSGSENTGLCLEGEALWGHPGWDGCDSLCPEGSPTTFSIYVLAAPLPGGKPVVSIAPCPTDLPKECCNRPKLDTSSDGGAVGFMASDSGGPFGGSQTKCCNPGPGGSPCSGGGGRGIIAGKGGGSGGASCSPPFFSSAPVQFSTGELALSATDIASDGYGVGWGHTRSFASRLSYNDTIGHGFNWQVEQWPYLVHPTTTQVVVQGRANTSFWFDEVNGEYVPQLSAKHTLIHDNANSVYRFYSQDGGIIEFDDLSGMFEKHVDPYGNQVEVTAMHTNGRNFTEVERTYTEGGSTTVEQYLYAYIKVDGDIVLQSVTMRRKVAAGAWKNVSRANYTYYDTGDTHGGLADLETVTTQIWESSQWNNTGVSMYRYYSLSSGSSSSSSSSSSGAVELDSHLLKYVVHPEAYQRLADDPSVSDPLTATNLKVSEYADLYLEYDISRRVTKEIVQGGSRTYTLSYTESVNADGYNSWKTKTVETLPGGGQNIVYANYAGQTMLSIFKSGSDQWLSFWKYDDNAHVVLHANPSAITGYDDTKADLLNETAGAYQYLSNTVGLIETYTYDAASGYRTLESFQEGENGASTKLHEYEYTACAITIGGGGSSSSSSSSGSSSSASTPFAYFISQETVYPSATDQTKKLITTYAYTFHPGTCQVLQKTTTLPLVAASQNGSAAADTRKEVFDTHGNLQWTMDERGFITRMIYDIPTGAVSQVIQDVDTTQVSDEPFGWTTPAGGGEHLLTDFEFDDLGRTTQSLGPAHSVDLNGIATSVRRATWTVYDDANHEVRTAQGYATGASWNTFTLVNPVNIIRFDQNGKALEEIQATRASTSGKLVAADTFAQSSYVRWTTHDYTDCCILANTKVYHTIPASGAGSEGANYDQTTFGYDSSKRPIRHVSPGGTVTRSVLDARSNTVKTYIGTDDTSATASDPTGGGAGGNNMVLVNEVEYDSGADGGDNLVTKETQHVS